MSRIISRRSVVAGSLGLVAAAASVGYWTYGGRDHPSDAPRLNTLSSPFAIKGHDPVGYATEGRPILGDPAFETTHAGARYRFASAANKARFDADPARYAPAFGGYCCYGVRMGMKYDIDPTAFKIVDGQLFMQLDPGTQHVWLQKRDENILIARQIWPDIRDVRPEDLPLKG